LNIIIKNTKYQHHFKKWECHEAENDDDILNKEQKERISILENKEYEHYSLVDCYKQDGNKGDIVKFVVFMFLCIIHHKKRFL
jgi:hypothetical protein